MSKEMSFFIYLIEKYAEYKGCSAAELLRILKEKNLYDFIYDMYEIYHCEAIENAFLDIDSLITTGKPAW